MNKIDEIINTTLENLHNKKQLITPSNYEKEFFSLFTKTDLILEEYVEFKDLVATLDKKEKEILLNENVNSFKDLAMLLSNRLSESETKLLLEELSYFMSPSLNNKDIESDIIDFCKEITNNSQNSINLETIKKLQELTKIRIQKDKKLFEDKTKDVKKLIFFLEDYLKKALNKSNNSLDEVHKIKEEISSLKLSSSSEKNLKILQKKLLNAAEEFENVINKNCNDMDETKEKCDILYEQIEELQVCLSKAEEEKSIDFLTGVLTRRAFDIETTRIEDQYKSSKSNYAIIFYDIDYFKKINDNYGHACGDYILKTFASMLNKLIKDEDIIVRYGGEEFVALVHYKNKNEIINYIKRVKNIITNNKFVYNDIKISVAFCAGVAFRNNYDKFEEVLIKSDELLYEAKHSGRNKIIFDSGEVL